MGKELSFWYSFQKIWPDLNLLSQSTTNYSIWDLKFGILWFYDITDDEDPIDHSLLHDSDLEDLDSDEEDNDVTFIDDDDNDAMYPKPINI